MTDISPVSSQLFEQGCLARLNGDYDRAIDLFKRIIDEAPDYVAAHTELGLAYCFTGFFDESIKELEHAVHLAPQNPDICLHLAKTYTMLGQYEEGAAAFRQVMTLSSPGEMPYDEAVKQLHYFKQVLF